MATATEHGISGEQRNPGDCAAHDIKELMGRVLDQIADSERRNGDLLRQMHGRLERLGEQTRQSRSSVPSEYLPGFDRIEDGMSLLAHRIAETYAVRTTPAATHVERAPDLADQPFAPAYVPAAAVDTVSQSLPATSYLMTGPRSPAEPPQPLRSSAAPLAALRVGKYGPNVDTFDVVESRPGNPAEPWAPDQVAALAEIYKSRDVLFTAEAAPAAATVIAGGESAPHERVWLESRLADIAARIDQSFSAVRPEATIASIERRFDDVERQLTAALHGLSSVADAHGLAVVESGIRELTGKIDGLHGEMMRLHGLERQIDKVVQQVGDDRLGAVIERAVKQHAPVASAAAPRADADLHTVAIAAAEAAASRVALAHREPARDAPRVDDVHAMLSSFIEERRQGDEHTASTLDTLQQAMLRILDRMETIEDGRSAPDDAAAFATLGAASARSVTSEAELPAPAPRVDVVAGDPIARQRAELQASAQRAAQAQREKLRADAPLAAPASGRNGQAAKSVPAVATGKARRLMVSAIALTASATIGFGAMMMSMPAAPAPVVATLVPPDTQPAVTVAAAKAGVAASAAADRADAKTQGPAFAGLPASPASPAPTHSIPETVTDDLGTASVVPEVDRVPETSRSNLARSSYAAEPATPVTGIMIQGAEALPTTAGGNAGAGGTGLKAVKASADAATAVGADAGAANGQARATVELPAATVGPLSLRLAAANGDPSAQFEVASRLAEGKGTDQNLKEAVVWYQRAATQGFAQAQYRLGTFHERGLGVKADLARAKSWYQRAADQGNVKAMHNLAVLAAGRTSATPDYATAVQWFTQAAGYGLADSQYNLAVLTESGLGTQKDMVQAATWFMLAAQAGDKEAVRRRDLIKAKMEKADYAAAEHLAKTWQAQVPDKLNNDARFAGEAWKARQTAAAAAADAN